MPVSILVAEDSLTQAEALREVLERHSFKVLVAHDGEHALELIRSERPTIIISDVLMPKLDGFQLCMRVKGNEALKRIPVILLTALSDSRDVVRGLECGADNFITKPYDEKYLLSRIRYVLDNPAPRELEGEPGKVPVTLEGRNYSVTSDRRQILDLLLSTYEAAVYKNQELARTEEELRKLNEQLERKVEERTLALRAEITERIQAQDALARARDELEITVEKRTTELRQRTRELEAANKELEAFSYSVSHDLRTPLRAIEGFSSLLSKRYGDKLDEQGKRDLDYILMSCKEMSQLINDLLALSKVVRTEIRQEPVEVSTLAEAIAIELGNAEPLRQVRFTSAPGIVALGDKGLIELLLRNLLSNAWKFTARQEVPRVEIGMTVVDGQRAFFVRDNGVGFDMSQSSRLFVPFRRLHSDADFPGTGIGLAIVQRAVHRHGGKVWAESKPGEGATFYFTLG